MFNYYTEGATANKENIWRDKKGRPISNWRQAAVGWFDERHKTTKTSSVKYERLSSDEYE